MGFHAAPVQGKLSRGVMVAKQSAGDMARKASAMTSRTTAGAMVSEGESEREDGAWSTCTSQHHEEPGACRARPCGIGVPGAQTRERVWCLGPEGPA